MRMGIAVAALLFSLPAVAADRLSLGYFGVKATGVTPAEEHAVSELLQSELFALGRYKVIAQSDIAALLGVERQKQLLGCSDEDSASCFSELAGALNVDRLVVADVARVGDILSMNISILDTHSFGAIARGTRRLKSNDVAALLDEIRPLLYEVVNADEVNKAQPLKLERGFGGLMVGARADGDVLGLGLAPGITVELSGRRVGAALVLLVKYLPGARLEGRFYPFTLGRVRTQVAAGLTAFTDGVGVRGAIGATVHFGQFQIFADVGYERFLYLRDWQGLSPNALTIGLGVGWLF
jgi:hypothetical protein